MLSAQRSNRVKLQKNLAITNFSHRVGERNCSELARNSWWPQFPSKGNWKCSQVSSMSKWVVASSVCSNFNNDVMAASLIVTKIYFSFFSCNNVWRQTRGERMHYSDWSIEELQSTIPMCSRTAICSTNCWSYKIIDNWRRMGNIGQKIELWSSH